MNVLNRFGWIMCPICISFIMGIVGKNFIDGYRLVLFRGTSNYFEMLPFFVLMLTFLDLTSSELRFTRFSSFYPESFFDRNWYVIIQTVFALYFFKENWQIVIVVAAIVLIANEFFRRWRTKKQMIAIENLKKVAGYPDFDATKFKFKHYQKNFFLRSWPMFIIPWALIVVPNSVIRGLLMFAIIIAFFAFEAVNLKNALKEIDEVVKTEDMI